MDQPKPNLPSYMSESVFRTYEHVIAHVVKRWPDVSVIDPKEYNLPRSINTCESRLRCAFQSFEKYKWTSNTINKKDFNHVWETNGCPTVAIRFDDDKPMLLVGPAKDVRQAKTVPQEAPKKQNKDVLIIAIFKFEEADIICSLAHNRALSRPIKMPLTQDQVTHFESVYDIAFEPLDDGTFLLL